MRQSKNQSTAKLKLEDLTTTTDLSSISSAQQLDLFEQLTNYVKTSNMKNDYKPLVGLMLDTIKAQSTKIKKLEDQVKAVTSSPIAPPSIQASNRNYSSFSNCTQGKQVEHPVVIRVAESISDKESIDLKKVVFEQLKPIKNKIEVIRVNKSRDSLILKVRDSEQQALMIDKLKSQPTISADKPKVKLPSILITEIERESDLHKKEDIEEFITSELVANEGIKKENIKFKVTMCNPKFYTIKCIVNLDAASTKAVLNKGYVKIGYKICPVLRTLKAVQCTRCLKFGHFEKNKDGTIACRSKSPSCNFCSGNHPEDQCTKDKTKPENKKCFNCGKCHTADYRNCEKRVERERELLSRCSC